MDCKSVYNILMISDCKSVATILENQIMCVEILCDFLVCMQKFNIKGQLQNNHAVVVLSVDIT
jgi:hypothetical protein